MTFLVPALLFALPLAALPVIIHLIPLYQRRQQPDSLPDSPGFGSVMLS